MFLNFEILSKVCLFGREEVSLRDAIRSGADDKQLIELIRNALNNKKKQHSGSHQFIKSFNSTLVNAKIFLFQFLGAFNIVKTANRPMILIGG
jgi:molybdenum cofactor biosynthesis enzyme MoaA